MENFEYNANSSHVLFGLGSREKLAAEVKRLSLTRPILISTPRQENKIQELAKMLGDASITVASVYPRAVMHTPTFVTEAAVERKTSLRLCHGQSHSLYHRKPQNE
jgi:alcohol dehydrogenase class IV